MNKSTSQILFWPPFQFSIKFQCKLEKFKMQLSYETLYFYQFIEKKDKKQIPNVEKDLNPPTQLEMSIN